MSLIRANEQYKVKITDFEGPLDLLLHLIREQKLEIKVVRLAQVTQQYLEFLKQLDNINMELASEFVEVGATLMEIKSKNILPRPEEEGESPEELEQRLLAQIEEYKLLKEASEKLKVIENVDRYYKEPVPLKTKYEWSLDNLSMEGLIAAFTKMLYKVERSAPAIQHTQIRLDRFTVADKIKDIRMQLSNAEKVQFFDLFPTDFTRGEVINTFLAVLELLKCQAICVKQESMFADIMIVRGEGYDANDNAEISEFDAKEDDGGDN